MFSALNLLLFLTLFQVDIPKVDIDTAAIDGVSKAFEDGAKNFAVGFLDALSKVRKDAHAHAQTARCRTLAAFVLVCTCTGCGNAACDVRF